MLTLPIKKQWYDMILSGEKKEEYREIKPYYTKRFLSCGLLKESDIPEDGKIKIGPDGPAIIRLRNGYSTSSPSFDVICDLKIGEGKAEWGATPGEKYYILEILSIE